MIFRIKNSVPALLLFAAPFCIAQSARAQSGGTFQLEQVVIASGGSAAGGTLSSVNAIGEPLGGGTMAGGRIQLNSGFFAFPPLLPTAARVNVTGRVLTADGRPIMGARLTLLNSAGAVKTVLTNAFGFYRFFDVPAGETYILAPSAKGHQFAPQVVTVNSDVFDLFVSALD